MANLTSNIEFNFFDLDLNLLKRAQTNWGLSDNIYSKYNGKTYEDLAYFEYSSNNFKLKAIFGGYNFSVNSSDKLTGGTVTGFLYKYFDGSQWKEAWAIESISYSVLSFASAASTTTTSDDYTIIK
jgi:hypothetical protein